MNLKLQGKTTFIMGSTSGIGRATARAFAQEGVHVILNGRRAVGVSTAVEKLQKEFNEVEVKGVAADFLYSDQIKALLGQLSEVDILIIMWVFIHQPPLLKRVTRIGIGRLK